jgi:sugar lactone lactonase YvrE
MTPSSGRRALIASIGRRAGPAHQVQPWRDRPIPYPGRQPRHTSMLATHGSNRRAPPATQSPFHRTQSAGQHGAASHEGLIDSFEGKKLNAPNDVVVASDGAVWFTDPGYGILGNYEGHKDTSEQQPRVYRLDVQSGRAKVVGDGFDKPNGIALSPDERKLYVTDSGVTHGGRSNIRSFDVNGDTLSNDKVFAEGFAPGFTDGVRIDVDGNVWCSMGWADPKEGSVAMSRAGN